MSLFKLSLLVGSSISFHMGLGRPSSPNHGDKIMGTTVRERMWRHTGIPSDLFLKVVSWSTTVGESTVIITSLLDALRLPDSVLNVLGPAEASTVTLPFVLGASLVIMGGMVRVSSFRELGPYYTFILCIRKDHQLITTGPYAVIRHPGYSGLLSCLFGWAMIHGSTGSWLRTSGVLDFRWSRIPLGCACFIMAASLVTVIRRSMEEDRYLSHRFGPEWDAWAQRVKYRLVPYVW